MASLRSKFFYQLLFAFFQLLFPLVTYPYITRTLGPVSLGKVAFIEFASGLIITIVAFGIPFYGVREVAKLQKQPGLQKHLFKQLFSVQLVTTIIGILGFQIFISSQDIEPSLIILGSVNILLQVFIAEWFLQGTESFKFLTIRGIVLRSIGLLFIFLLVNHSEDYVIYYTIIVGTQLLVALSNWIRKDFHSFGFANPSVHLRSLFYFFLTSSLISVYVFFDVIILGSLVNDYSVGIYSSAIKIIKLSLLMVLSLNIILFPRISSLHSEANFEEIKRLVTKALSFIIILTLPLGIAFYLLAENIILLLAGPEFIEAANLIKILSFLPMIVGLSNVFVYQLLVPFGKERTLIICIAFATIFSLILHFLLVRQFEAIGSAIATLGTEIIVTVLTGYYSFKLLELNFPKKLILNSIFAVLPVILIIFILKYLTGNNLVIIILAGLISLLIYNFIHLKLLRTAVYLETWLSLKEFFRFK